MNLTFAVVLALFAQTSPSLVDSRDKAKAQALLTEGTSLYERGNYAQALEKFEAAYATYPSQKLWFNIGKANRDLGRPVEALDAFEKFLTGAPEASFSTKTEARVAAEDLKQKLGQLRIECDPPGAEVTVDGKSHGLAPLPGLVWVVPGRHQVTATHARGQPALKTVEVKAMQISPVGLRIAAPPTAVVGPGPAPGMQITTTATRPIATPEPSSGGRKWTWVAAGSTVLLAGSALTLGLLNQAKYNDLNQSCGKESTARLGCDRGEINSLETRQTVATVLWGATGVAAMTAIVLFVVEGGKGEDKVKVAPMVGQTTGLLARVEF
jgi:hypothetical protein